MAYYDDSRDRTTRYVERRERDSRYGEPRESYLRVHQSGQLVPRAREDSDLSIEEVHRDFPPPGYVNRDIRRARSAEPGAGAYYEDDRRSVYTKADRYDRYDDRDRGYDRYDDRDRHRHRDDDTRSRRDDEEAKRHRVLSKQEKIIAALVGGAIAVGGKELYDRREAKSEHRDDVGRNPLASAALGAAGALAAYQGADFYNKKAHEKDEKSKTSTLLVHKSRDGRVTDAYYSEEEGSSKEKKGHDNFLEKALAAAGLGGAAKMLLGGGAGGAKDDKSDTRSRKGSKSRSRSPKGGTNKVQKAAMASLIAGATEAFRVSKEPGGWRGEKAKRVLTAAAGAATIDSVQGEKKEGSKLGLAESVIGGLLGNRLIHGSAKNIEEDKATGRSRSRSRARSSSKGGGSSGIAALATAGLGAIGAKKIMDHRERSKSRNRSRDSYDSRYDSRDVSPEPRRRSRSRSVVDSARRSLAKIGIGNGPEDEKDRDYESPRGARRRRNDYDDGDSRDTRDRGHGRRDDYYDDERSYRDRSRSRSRGGGGRRRRGSYSSSDLGDSDEDEKKAKKIRGKSILTTGLAAVATIHATHNVVQSMEKRNSRHKAVREGRLTAEEAKKLKSKAMLQDAASIGIAALGIKGAISEMKEAKEKIHELHEWQDEKQKRHERRMERQQRNRRTIKDANSDGRRQDDGYHGDDDDYYYPTRRSRADNWSTAAPARSNRYDDGPYYNDGNPYAALPAPPVGRDRDRDDRRR